MLSELLIHQEYSTSSQMTAFSKSIHPKHTISATTGQEMIEINIVTDGNVNIEPIVMKRLRSGGKLEKVALIIQSILSFYA